MPRLNSPETGLPFASCAVNRIGGFLPRLKLRGGGLNRDLQFLLDRRHFHILIRLKQSIVAKECDRNENIGLLLACESEHRSFTEDEVAWTIFWLWTVVRASVVTSMIAFGLARQYEKSAPHRPRL
jgi:hypothetical protein